LSGDLDQNYFSEGITEDIIFELSHFREVSLRASSGLSEQHRRSVDVKQLGRELGVQYVAQGSVRRLDHRTRIIAQLIDTASGDHIWSERFDRHTEEIFAVQDEVVRTIVATLVGRLQAAGAEQAKRKPPASLAAYECVLRGKALPVGEEEAEAEARRLYQRAIELDPHYARAHALLAYMLSLQWFRDMSGTDALLDHALELATRAVALDENDRLCQDILGWVYLNRKSFGLAELHKQRALDLNPSHPEQIACTGVLYTFLGRADDGIAWLERANRMDPFFDPMWRWRMLGVAQFVARRYEEAIKCLRRFPRLPVWVQAYLAACYALLGKVDSAREYAALVRQRDPDFSLTRFATKEPFKRAHDRDRLIEGMRASGLPE
jgi:adenylate cyclase